jgi:hypothetical protein
MKNTIVAIIITAGLAIPFSFLAGSLTFRADRQSQKQQIADLQTQLKESELKLNNALDDLEKMSEMWKNTHNALAAAQSQIKAAQQPRQADTKSAELTQQGQARMTAAAGRAVDGICKSPFFDVYLGEPLENIDKRLGLTGGPYSSSDEDSPEEMYFINSSRDTVKNLGVATFNKQVFQIMVYLKDTSETNFSTIKAQLEKKYNVENQAGLFDSSSGGARFSTNVDGIKVYIYLDRDVKFGEDNDLTILYVHAPLYSEVEKVIKLRKAEKVNQQL